MEILEMKEIEYVEGKKKTIWVQCQMEMIEDKSANLKID